MKLAAFDWNGSRHVGQVMEDGTVQRFDIAADRVVEAGVAALIGAPLPPVAQAIPLAEVTLRAPIPRPRRNIFCVGKNYHDHAHEFANSWA